MNFSEFDVNQTDLNSPLKHYQEVLDAEFAAFYNRLSTATLPIALILATLGYVGNVLALVVVHISASSFFSDFRRIMISTSILDLGFFLMKMFKSYYPVVDQTSLILVMLSAGISYSCSLLSDCLALTLTALRFLALVYPGRFQALGPSAIRNYWIVSSLVSVLISLTRMHYSLANYTFAIVTDRYLPFVRGLQYVSDTVIPFTLTVLSSLLVLGMSYAMRLRIKTRKRILMVDNGKLVKKDEMASVVSLLWALLILCFVDQLGYIAYDITGQLTAVRQLPVFTDAEEYRRFHNARLSYGFFAQFSSVTECLARSAGFYLYLCFNQTFRQGCLRMIRRRPTVQQTQTKETAITG